MKNINFIVLEYQHLPLLLKWLNTPHVKAWWDSDVEWDIEKIHEKYASYVLGYKIIKGIRKPINAFIILYENVPIGYIQHYNAYDFPRKIPLKYLPQSLAAFDMYLGEANYLRRGIGAEALSLFLTSYLAPFYKSVFVDPEVNNQIAINTYKRAGFIPIEYQPDNSGVWMIKTF